MRNGFNGWAIALVAFVGTAVGCGDDAIDWERHNWPIFGRDQNNTRHAVNETRIGTDNVAGLEERWRWPAGGDGPAVTSTPLVVDGVVYIGTWRGLVTAIDARTGEQLWENRPAGAGTIDSTLCVTDDRIFVGDGSGRVHAMERDGGEVLWTTPVEPDMNTTHMYSSPVYIEEANLVVIGVASIEVALGVDDYMFRGSVVGLDADSGDILWQTYLTNNDSTSGAGVSVWSTVGVDTERQLVFIGTGQNYEPPASEHSDALIAFDYTTGEIVWSRQFTADDVFTIFGEYSGPDWDVGASPNLYQIDGRDVVGVADKRGVYSALDRETGETVWATELTAGSSLGGVMSTAAYHEGSLYVASNEWAEVGSFDNLENSATVFQLDADTGDIGWEKTVPAPVFGALTLANGVVYVTTIIGTVHGLDASTGEILWDQEGLEDIGGGTSVAAGLLYVPHGFVFFGAASTAPGGLVAYGRP